MTAPDRHAAKAAEITAKNPLICGPCGAPLPNPDCAHRKNGLSPVCSPQTESLEADIAAALREADKNAREECIEIAYRGHCTSSGCDPQTTGHSNLCPIGIAEAIRATIPETPE